ncbi:hypothetical protein SAMN02745166_00894 [Prosthecobacter debontii]|uniref:Uncharacterized protein n=1 Tax=Prosthecobacter debontii TaxID=48467 RepID=A0A1T4WY68_9BACT|nr:hypothetical protein [Prosthecobacter debontii]SKA82333.1 hypothetical protein SAMN02745166_00894 [Prosthecobacter debontii]
MTKILNVLVLGTAIVAVCKGDARGQVSEPNNSIAASAGDFVARVIFWTEDQTPADFLEMAGQHTKARWRTMYRPQPPSPTADRNKAAFTLGSLIGETFLIWEAGDSQQFRNNNQDIVTYCRMLGLGERMKPRLMAQAKMAETDEWKELRQEIVDGHQEVMRMLREQMDDDLAVLVDIGAWMRSLEIVSKLVVEIPDVDKRPLCIGSPALLADLRQDFATLGDDTRRSSLVQPVIQVLTELEKVWNDKNVGPPTQSMVARTHEQLREVMAELTLK